MCWLTIQMTHRISVCVAGRWHLRSQSKRMHTALLVHTFDVSSDELGRWRLPGQHRLRPGEIVDCNGNCTSESTSVLEPVMQSLTVRLGTTTTTTVNQYFRRKNDPKSACVSWQYLSFSHSRRVMLHLLKERSITSVVVDSAGTSAYMLRKGRQTVSNPVDAAFICPVEHGSLSWQTLIDSTGFWQWTHKILPIFCQRPDMSKTKPKYISFETLNQTTLKAVRYQTHTTKETLEWSLTFVNEDVLVY